MNSYERVVAALQLKEPDRIPTFEFYVDGKVIEGLYPGCSYFDFVERMDLDAVAVRDTRSMTYVPGTNNTVGIDHWGSRWQKTAEAWSPVEGPIKSMDDLKKYVPPDPNAYSIIADVERAVKRFKDKRFIVYHCRAEFMTAADLRGFSDFLIDFVDNPELVHGITRVVSDYFCTVVRNAMKAGADGVVFGDDWAFSGGPFMSPRQFREMVLPYFKRAVDTVHEAGGLVVKHADGNLWSLLEATMEADPDGLHPIQPDAGMELGEVKAKYGKRVCLLGNVDCGYILSDAPVEEVVQETRKTIRKGGPGGGYILTSSNSLHSSVKPENYKAMVDTCHKYGKYPLDMAALS